MDQNHQQEMTNYKTIAAINADHHIYLVQHQHTHRICIRKVLDVYNINVYRKLSNKPVTGVPRIRGS